MVQATLTHTTVDDNLATACRICGRKLTSLKSRQAGMGAVCARKQAQLVARAEAEAKAAARRAKQDREIAEILDRLDGGGERFVWREHYRGTDDGYKALKPAATEGKYVWITCAGSWSDPDAVVTRAKAAEILRRDWAAVQEALEYTPDDYDPEDDADWPEFDLGFVADPD